MLIAQAGIAVFGVSAIWLSQDMRESRRRWSSVCGLCAQPFWFAETISVGQWGILALSLIYAWSWARGFYGYWLKPRLAA